MSERVIAVIPSRWASSRFPGKPLAEISGKPMIQWVYERTSQAAKISETIVATDDERIVDVDNSFNGKVVMTPSDLPSGTDRVACVVESLDVDAVINVQGDEPLIEPEAIDLLVDTLLQDGDVPMATLARKITDPEEMRNYNSARVVFDNKFNALYFCRQPIPYVRDVEDNREWIKYFPYYDHIGIYAYRKDFLMQYSKMPVSTLEQAEKLEQLRALENGYKIKVGVGDFNPICVDVPEDLMRVEKRIKELKIA
jgi:3-deoxy-manno-octulosonate cytidylyltransferase (CMP-KDO synthetase)